MFLRLGLVWEGQCNLYKLFKGLVLVGCAASGCWTALIYAVKECLRDQHAEAGSGNFFIAAVGLIVSYGIPTTEEIIHWVLNRQ
jgi:hypothetical protein